MNGTLTQIRDCAAFAVRHHATCHHCGERIEWRCRLGWLHVEAFFTCGVPEDDGEVTTASP